MPDAVDRLEGLAGLSVQDAELKLFAEQQPPAAPEQSEPSSETEKNDLSDNAGAARNANNNSNNKAKKGKKQVAVSQRGPLLITHTGEPYLTFLFCYMCVLCVYVCVDVGVFVSRIALGVTLGVTIIYIYIFMPRWRVCCLQKPA